MFWHTGDSKRASGTCRRGLRANAADEGKDIIVASISRGGIVVGGTMVFVPRPILVVPVATTGCAVVAIPPGAGAREGVVAVPADRLHVNVFADARAVVPAL